MGLEEIKLLDGLLKANLCAALIHQQTVENLMMREVINDCIAEGKGGVFIGKFGFLRQDGFIKLFIRL